MGTVQFAATLQACAKELESLNIFKSVSLPQTRPLSKGEVLGCTSPKLDQIDETSIDLVIFIADGRFHIESAMIMNPKLPIFRYNPYDKTFTRELYNHIDMKITRKKVIETAISLRKSDPTKPWVVLLSTLGRQGNPKILNNLIKAAKNLSPPLPIIPVLMAEIQPEKLKNFKNTEVFVQIGCPRLSIDWGPDTVEKPLLTPYEGMIAMENMSKRPEWLDDPENLDKVYPMDFYSNDSSGNWTNNHVDNRPDRSAIAKKIRRSKQVVNL